MLLNSHISAYASCLAGKVCSPVRSTWGTSLGEDKLGARDRILNTKVAHRGRTFPPHLCYDTTTTQRVQLSEQHFGFLMAEGVPRLSDRNYTSYTLLCHPIPFSRCLIFFVAMPDNWKLLKVSSKMTFEELCRTAGLPYVHGCGFYELSGAEMVPDKKVLVASNEESGEVISGGEEVRRRLGLEGKIMLNPRMIASPWTLYVNSTSANRCLKPNTTVAIRLDAAAVSDAPHEAAAADTKKRLRPETAAPAEEAGKPSKSARQPAGGGADHCAAAASSSSSQGDLMEALARWTQRDADGWLWHGTLMAYATPAPTRPRASPLVAAFDFDGCVANTSLFKKGPDAWTLLYATVPSALQELHDRGYRLVVMSNQATIGKATKSKAATIAEKKGRFNGFVAKIGLPFTVLAATASTAVPDDPFRKPADGMWTFLERHLNDGVAVDRRRSFFVGDAAGRKKDHSDSDLRCAKAYGVPFWTEEECFVAHKYRTLF